MEGLSSMDSLHIKLLIIGTALFAIVIALHFNFGSFVSDYYLETRRKGSAIPADPTCPKGRYSKKTGGPCSGPSSDDYDYSKDPPETAIGATGERYNVGSYDRNPNKKDDVDYTDSDVLTKAAKIKYPDWALDPKTNKDINTNSKVSSWQFRGKNDVVEDEDGLPSGRTRKDPYDYRYDTTLKSGRNFRNSGDHDEYDTSKKHEYAKKNRPSVDELIRAKDRKHSDFPQFRGKRDNDEEDDYLDNRLTRDYKRRERQFELPYEKSYNRESTKGYSSGATCNNKSYDKDGDEPEEDECCEGFSTFK
jgi:hypothetical protein